MSDSCHNNNKRDYFYICVLVIGALLYSGHFVYQGDHFSHLFHSFFELINTMVIGVVLGIFFVSLMGEVPREYVLSLIGKPGSKTGVLRATAAGFLLDLCSHGILMVGMKLYERGASMGQVVAFLVASPWNSFSLTIIMITLMGFKWTLSFILLSGLIAIISGIVFDGLIERKILPTNPHHGSFSDDFNFWQQARKDFKNSHWDFARVKNMFKRGLIESNMIIKWLLFGSILSSFIQTFVSEEIFNQFFGPSLLGLGLTLVATTIIEVCSEGSTPIAADLLPRDLDGAKRLSIRSFLDDDLKSRLSEYYAADLTIYRLVQSLSRTTIRQR